MYGGGSRLLGGMRAMLGIGETVGVGAVNLFDDLSATGNQILANPNEWLRALHAGTQGDHTLSEAWNQKRDERRGQPIEVSPQAKAMQGAALGGIKPMLQAGLEASGLDIAANTWAYRNPNAAQSLGEYATSPTMEMFVRSAEVVAPAAVFGGNRLAQYVAKDVADKAAAGTLGEALFETLAPKGLPAGGQTGIFAGRQSLTNLAESGKKVRTSHGELDAKDLYANRARAEKMTAAGAGAAAVWNETGWFQGADDMWRYEIDDSEATYDPTGLTDAGEGGHFVGRLDQALDHPDAFAAFPERQGGGSLINQTMPGAEASYAQPLRPGEPETINMGVEAGRSEVLHELTHGIQYDEGMNRGASATGGTPRVSPEFQRGLDEWNDIMIQAGYPIDNLVTRDMIEGSPAPFQIADELEGQGGWLLDNTDMNMPEVDAILSEKFGAYQGISDPLSDYRTSAGEVEARNVQARRDLTPRERAEIPPIETESVPRADQWVDLKGGGTPQMAPAPATLGTALEQALTPHTTQGPPTRQPKPPANRDQRWASQQATAQRIRGQRNKKTGVYLGAPKHIDTPAKKNGLVTAYANRVDRAIANGVAPGYFYDDGARAIGEIAEPGQALKTGQGTGVTSTMVGPEENMNYLVKGREQQTMAGPAAVSTTLFPNASQSEFINTMNPARETPWLGHKRERYANLLVPEGDLPPDMPEGSMLAPNDRWEGRGAGFAGPPSGELQVSWNDEIRELAQARVNKRRAARGEAPLTVKQVQELHWAQIRADADGRTPKIRPSDTISGSIDRLEYQHSWETNPGKTSNHNPEVGGTIPAADYHADLKPLLIGEDGKDKLIRGMSGGGAFQRQAIDGPGEYKGQYSPSTQSRSLVSHTKSGGLDKVSEARVGANEAVRSFILAQDADAGSLFAPLTTPKGKFNALAFNPGKPISEAQLKAINARVRANFGVKAADDIVVVPTAGGVRIFHPSPDRKFPKRLAAMNDEIKKITGVDGVKGSTQSHYNELGWEKGTATADMLKVLDNPDAPLLLKHANSRQVRQLMGSFADKYEALQKAGLSPNQKLIDVLKAWRDRGLPAVREMVKAGTAPAAALAILSQEE